MTGDAETFGLWWLKAMRLMNANWPTPAPTVEDAELLGEMLQDLDGEDVYRAVTVLVNEPGRQFRPKVGEIRDTVLRITGRQQPDWTAALERLIRAVQYVGMHQGYRLVLPGQERSERLTDEDWTVEVRDPGILRWIAICGGWYDTCQLDYTDGTVRAQFRDIYRAAANQAVEAATLAALDWNADPPALPETVQ